MTAPTPTPARVAVPLAGVPRDLSPLVLGTMTFGDTVGPDVAREMLDLALEAGVTAVDTANAYAGGATEEMLATLLRGRREDVLLATKAGMPHPDAAGRPLLSREALRASVHGSLRRLDVEVLDVLYLHQPDRATPLEETLAAVAGLVAEGAVRALGVSNYAAWQVVQVQHVADDVGCPRPVVAQQMHNLLARRVEEEHAEMAAVTGVRTVVYNPLGGGLLTGRYTEGAVPGEGRFGTSALAGMYRDRYFDPRLFAAVEELSAVSSGAGLPLAEMALRWLAGRPDVDAVLLGGSRVEQLRANLAAAARGPLPDDVAAACDAVGAGLRGPMPAYHR